MTVRLPCAAPLRLLALLAVPVAPALVAAACGGGNENLPPPPPPPPPPPSAPDAAPVANADAAAGAAPATPPPAPPVELLEGVASPDPPAPTPVVKFVSPTKDQLIPTAKAADFDVKLDVKNWKTAQGDAHVHLILDDKPYKPIYDPKVPVKLSELTGADALGEGPHILVAFPSRANHESVKTPGALAVLPFAIGAAGKKGGEKAQDPTKPLLIYSRPKGQYKGEMANHVLIDFELANDTLAPGKDHVRIAVSGPGIEGEKTADATSFGSPYYLDNLQDGTYTVKLELQGPDGTALPGPWNSVSRTFDVAH